MGLKRLLRKTSGAVQKAAPLFSAYESGGAQGLLGALGIGGGSTPPETAPPPPEAPGNVQPGLPIGLLLIVGALVVVVIVKNRK